MIIDNYIKPDSIDKAASLVDEGALIIGGGGYFHLAENRIVKTVIDLSSLNLSFIKDENDYIEMGAMTTFREIETSEIIKNNFSGILSKAVSNILGVQMRNVVTVGGTVAGKYGFSDFLTPLLVLDTKVVLYKNGEMSFEKYLNSNITKDIVLKIKIKKSGEKAAYQNFRNITTDYPILNCAVARLNNKYKIAVGARPMKAVLAADAMDILNDNDLNDEIIKKAAQNAAKLDFKSDLRASEEYRRGLCSVLVKRALSEVK